MYAIRSYYEAERFDFVLAADECYCEIYLNEGLPPVGLLQAAQRLGRDDFRRCVVFHSLSKRSNLPGLRSGFVAGDAAVLGAYFKYRTYQGCALPAHTHRITSYNVCYTKLLRIVVAREDSIHDIGDEADELFVLGGEDRAQVVVSFGKTRLDLQSMFQMGAGFRENACFPQFHSQ